MEQRNQNLRVCFVSTYPPRPCGIATFTYDLRQEICSIAADVHASVIAISNKRAEEYPPEVIFEIRHNQPSKYRLAAEYLNLSSVEVVCLQHEFGIFGGPEGRYVSEFLNALHKPVVTTLHTVLPAPNTGYRDSLVQVARASDLLVVMNKKAIPILKDVYGIPESKIAFAHHGVPDVPFVDPNYYKDKFGVEGKLVILTFGLLNRNKGIETMLDALRDIVPEHPEVVYIVLGATHPEVKRHEGEEYRLWLKRRVRELGLERHVIFYDRYVQLSELLEFIGASDIYVTPYRSRDQIVSGTLAYAVGMGKAVISSPYLYATELLADGRGELVDPGDSGALSRTILNLIEKPAVLHRMRKQAYEYGREMIWPEVAARYVALLRQTAARESIAVRTAQRLPESEYELPEIKLDHLLRLTDDTGIIQHATYGIPDRRSGYSTDDVGRGLVVALLYHGLFGSDPYSEASIQLAAKYLSFLQYAQLPDGHFHNFMSYTREFLDERGSEDTLGRALWGLGMAVAYAPTERMRALARDVFERALNVLELEHPRAMAYSICGLYSFLVRYDGAAQVRRKLADVANQLAGCFERSRSDEWRWFGDEATYANAKMPHAMLLAYLATKDERFKRIGLESLDFLLEITYRDGRFDFIGNQGWYHHGRDKAVLAQQPIEAGYTAEACITAYEITGERRYVEMAQAAAEWLLGRNRLEAPLYDLTTGACADGLDPQGVSMNQGAESVICGLLTLLVVASQREKDTKSEPVELSATPQTSGFPVSPPPSALRSEHLDPESNARIRGSRGLFFASGRRRSLEWRDARRKIQHAVETFSGVIPQIRE